MATAWQEKLLVFCFSLAALTAAASGWRVFRLWPLLRQTTLAPALWWLGLLLALAFAEAASYAIGPHLVVHHSLAILTAIGFVLPTIYVLCTRRPRLLASHALVALFLLITSNDLWLQLYTGQFGVEGRPALHQVRFLYLCLFTALVAGNYVLSRLRVAIFAATLGAFAHLLSVGPWPKPWEPWARAIGLLLIVAAPLFPVRLAPVPDRIRCIVRCFVDLWGVVWWEHVRERFNDAARRRRWPVRLTLSGLVDADSEQPVAGNRVDRAVEEELLRLLERFAPREFFTTACASASRGHPSDG